MSNSLKRLKSTGFTIVELLIVIVVIGILAAVSVVAYNGVQKNALDKAVLSDVEGVSGEVARYGTKNQGVYSSSVAWYSPSGANSNISFVPSSGTVIDVVTNNTDYCIRGYNTFSKTYNSLSASAKKESTPGACSSIAASAVAQAASPIINGGVVTTFAGSSQGSVDATSTNAQFWGPTDIAKDQAGNLYVIDSNNARIRKITSAGVVTTLAGSTSGYADGVGTSAQFNVLSGIAVDASGTVYVADQGNFSAYTYIRKITSAGVVTTLAGSTSGYADGTGSSARFNSPGGMAIDSSGVLYFADMSNNRIRKITSAGVVTTLAGSTAGYLDDIGAGAKFNYPVGIAVDGSGTVFVGDYLNYKIRKITSAGVVTTLAGSTSGYVDATGPSAEFGSTDALTIDASGSLYLADQSNNLIRKITSAGVVTTVAGSTSGYLDGTATAAKFSGPRGITINSAGTIYVGDSFNNRIRAIN